jgi:hypothetical protein
MLLLLQGLPRSMPVVQPLHPVRMQAQPDLHRVTRSRLLDNLLLTDRTELDFIRTQMAQTVRHLLLQTALANVPRLRLIHTKCRKLLRTDIITVNELMV